MKVRPGARLVWLLVAGAIWSLVGLAWPAAVWLLPVLLILALAGVVADYRSIGPGAGRRQRPPPDSHSREPRQAVSDRGWRLRFPQGRPWSVEIRQELPGPAVPTLWLERVDVPTSGEAAVVRWIRIPLRGRYTIRAHLDSSARPAWAAWKAQKSVGTSRARSTSIPKACGRKKHWPKTPPTNCVCSTSCKQSRQRGVGTEFESLADFRPGDDPRRVDWRLSAKYRRPIVRRYQIERHRDLIVLVDCGRLMGADARAGTKLDCAVDAALRLIRTALRVGDRCGLGIFDNEVRGYLRPIGGVGSPCRPFWPGCYALDSRWRESDFSPMFATVQSRQPKRALIIVLSDVVDVETSRRYRAVAGFAGPAARRPVGGPARRPCWASSSPLRSDRSTTDSKRRWSSGCCGSGSKRFINCAAPACTCSTSSRRNSPRP